MTHVTAVFDQRAYRFRADDGNEAGATWLANENTGLIDVDLGVTDAIRLRIGIQETAGGANNNVNFTLQYQIGTGAFQNVDSSTTEVIYRTSAHVANQAATTDQLTTPTGTFAGGAFVSASGSPAVISFNGNDNGENEYSLQLIAADLNDGDTINFRLLGDGAVLNNYTVTPTLTVTLVESPGEGTFAVADEATVGWSAARDSAAVFTVTDEATVGWVGDSSATGGPTGLTATPVSASQIDLEWDAYAGATGYDIEIDDVTVATDVQGTTYQATGLDPDTQYKFRVGAVPGTEPSGPLFATSVDSGGRYLLDQHGQPFLVRADETYSVPFWLSHSTTDLNTYFGTRAGQGFNAVVMNMLPPLEWESHRGATVDGVWPFVGQNSNHSSIDVTAPNETFWARMDNIFDVAAFHGITLITFPLSWSFWVGVTGETSMITNQGTGGWQTYGEFIGDRYGSRPNVIWGMGHDFRNVFSWWSIGNPHFAALETGLRLGGATQPLSVQLYQQPSHDNSTLAGLLDFSMIYTYNPVYPQIHTVYALNAYPALHFESQFEGENNEGQLPGNADATALRRQACWALTAGSPGVTYGSLMYLFPSGWQTSGIMTTDAVAQHKALLDFWETLAWQTLAPDQSSTLVTSGAGTYYSSGGTLANTHATRCRNAAGTLNVVYIPTSRTITVAHAQIPGTVTARWVDPSTGQDSTATPSGDNYTTPGNNADGDGDWLLVLEGSG